MTDNVLQCMEIWRLQKPTTYAHEIRNRLYLEGICNGSTLPSESSIQHSLHDKLGMTSKKVCQIPTERAKNIWKVDDFLQITQGLSPTTLHFFDEASVVKTTSNRLYGSSYKGTKAVEVQRYASNATYTVNLLHSVFGVDYYNIIPAASNGEELIAFFDYALECERSDGLPVFLEGDTLVMDDNVGSVCTAFPTLLGPRTLITHGFQRLMGCILLTMHCRSQQCWELLRPFACSLRALSKGPLLPFNIDTV